MSDSTESSIPESGDLTPTPQQAPTGLQDSPTPADSRPWLRPYRWAKGQSGNRSGKRHGETSILAALKRRLAKGETADQVAKALIEGAIQKRDPACLKILLDRIDGPIIRQLEANIQGALTPTGPVEVIFNIPNNNRPDKPVIDLGPAPQLPPDTGSALDQTRP